MAEIAACDLAWALGSCCALEGKPFDAQLLLGQHAPPYDPATLVRAARDLGFSAQLTRMAKDQLRASRFRVLLLLQSDDDKLGVGLLVVAGPDSVSWIPSGSTEPKSQPWGEFLSRFTGQAVVLRLQAASTGDPDQAQAPAFGFGWFVPELLKHRKVWREVLVASFVLQLLALGMPLFTQVLIDKVVVHQTESTLVAVAVGMGIFLFATAVLTWVRQYLVLHTGNRVDAVLAACVFDHLLGLPLRYFQHRSTGVVAARLQGVETIREFVSSAAVTLVLDIPFLLVAVAVMLNYSVALTCIALVVLLVIGLVSALAAPVFQARLNEQFLLGARNQAFLTEYIAGFETVKSLQLEPPLKARYAAYLASYLDSGFRTRQFGNTYQVAAGTLEQVMTVLILLVGAWTVMHPPADGRDVFTIGMLVAFQMFAARLSQPVMRLVGLWQQLQQARLAIARLGDLMNAPKEPYGIAPSRKSQARGHIEIQGLGFRYADDRPWLFRELSLTLGPGKVIALMGPSGCGKSTLAKLLLGFHQPCEGQIQVDGIDTRQLSANELRSSFGVVPQETTLFSGTIYENLALANPHASFDQVVQACRMAEVHEVIQNLPQGYRTPIGERGAGLSGGQKQRLAIARALLKRPKVLVFDEATSALDAETEEHFARTVNALRGKVSMIFITHALPKSLRIDEVLHLGRAGARQLHAVATERGEGADAGTGETSIAFGTE